MLSELLIIVLFRSESIEVYVDKYLCKKTFTFKKIIRASRIGNFQICVVI